MTRLRMFDGLSGLPTRFGKTKPVVRPARNSFRRAATSGEMSTKRTEFAVLSSEVSCLPFACWMIRTVVKSSSKSLISRPRSSPMRQPQEAARIMSIRYFGLLTLAPAEANTQKKCTPQTLASTVDLIPSTHHLNWEMARISPYAPLRPIDSRGRLR